MICDGKEEKYCLRCGDEIKYHQMLWGCAVVHEGTECESNSRCDCDCTPCMHKAQELAKRETRKFREIMSSKQYVRPLEGMVKILQNGNGKATKYSTKQKIKVSATTTK